MPGRAGGGDHLERRLDPELGLDHGDDGLRADAARPHTTDRALVRIGRLTTTIALIVAILWAPQIQHFASLWGYLASAIASALRQPFCTRGLSTQRTERDPWLDRRLGISNPLSENFRSETLSHLFSAATHLTQHRSLETPSQA
jgi:hypothetical protein